MKTKKPYSNRLVAATAGVFCVLASLAGCGSGEATSGLFEEDERLKVLALTTQIADAAQIVGGEGVQVVGMMRAGEDPHTYDPNPQDAMAMDEADLVLGNGLNLEAIIAKLVESRAADKTVYLAESGDITPLMDEGAESAPDPHCWMDPDNFKVYVEGIRDAMIEKDPANAEGYTARAEAYLKELDELDAWVREQFAEIPEAQRVVITGHDAFNYYGEAYGVEMHGLIGLTTEEQPTASDIMKLEKKIVDNGIKALFYETSVSATLNNLITQMAEQTKIGVGGELFSDSLDEPGTEAGTYLGMMRYNTTTMVEALKGGG
ncbi:MAG: zinc ABC transporter substrate-binding protein [Planctomycetota bacterium]